MRGNRLGDNAAPVPKVAAAIVGGAVSGAGVEDPGFLVLVGVVVTGFSTLGRLIVVRAGNALGWVFLVMGV